VTEDLGGNQFFPVQAQKNYGLVDRGTTVAREGETGTVMAAELSGTWLPRNPNHTAPITIPTTTSAAARITSRLPRPTFLIFFRSPSTLLGGCSWLIRRNVPTRFGISIPENHEMCPWH